MKMRLDAIRARAEGVKYSPEIEHNVWCLLDTDIPALLAEVERLNRVIAKELTENDDLGCEYTYVNALREELQTQIEVFTKMVNDREVYIERLEYALRNALIFGSISDSPEAVDAEMARLKDPQSKG